MGAGRRVERGTEGVPVGAGRLRRAAGEQLVEDVKVSLARRLVRDAPLLQQVGEHRRVRERRALGEGGGARGVGELRGGRIARPNCAAEELRARLGGVDLHQLAEARRVAVAHGDGAAEGLEHGVRGDQRVGQRAALAARVVRQVRHERAARLGLAGARLARHDDRLVARLRDEHAPRAVGDRVDVRRQHAERAPAVPLHRLLGVQRGQPLVRVEREQHGAGVRVDRVGAVPQLEVVEQVGLVEEEELCAVGHAARHLGRAPPHRRARQPERLARGARHDHLGAAVVRRDAPLLVRPRAAGGRVVDVAGEVRHLRALRVERDELQRRQPDQAVKCVHGFLSSARELSAPLSREGGFCASTKRPQT